MHDLDTGRPRVTFTDDGRGPRAGVRFHRRLRRVSRHLPRRRSLPIGCGPSSATYPFGWLGILADAAPTSDELVYSLHERGFALFSMRSPSMTRLYLQCAPDEDARCVVRRADLGRAAMRGWRPTMDGARQGPDSAEGRTGMRSFVAEPMRYGALFLAGDAAHIVPPTGAKGLNLAMADVARLADAFDDYYRGGPVPICSTSYSDAGLRRVWRAPALLVVDDVDAAPRAGATAPFDYRRQLAELDYLVSSTAAMTSLAENYVGTPID